MKQVIALAAVLVIAVETIGCGKAPEPVPFANLEKDRLAAVQNDLTGLWIYQENDGQGHETYPQPYWTLAGDGTGAIYAHEVHRIYDEGHRVVRIELKPTPIGSVQRLEFPRGILDGTPDWIGRWEANGYAHPKFFAQAYGPSREASGAKLFGLMLTIDGEKAGKPIETQLWFAPITRDELERLLRKEQAEEGETR